jgi:hypothetical protein
VNGAIFLKGCFVVEARVPDQKDRLTPFEVYRYRAGVEDRERQLAAIAGIDMKSRNID